MKETGNGYAERKSTPAFRRENERQPAADRTDRSGVLIASNIQGYDRIKQVGLAALLCAGSAAVESKAPQGRAEIAQNEVLGVQKQE